MATSYADLMYRVLTLVGEYGRPRIVAGEGLVIIYAQTSDQLIDGYFPVYTDGFNEARVEEILSLVDEAEVNLSYENEFFDEWSEATFSAFVISPISVF